MGISKNEDLFREGPLKTEQEAKKVRFDYRIDRALITRLI